MLVVKRKTTALSGYPGFGGWKYGGKEYGTGLFDDDWTDAAYRAFVAETYGARCPGVSPPQELINLVLNRRFESENTLRGQVADYIAAHPCQRASDVVLLGRDAALRAGIEAFRARHGRMPPDRFLDEIEDATAGGAVVGQPYLDGLVRTVTTGTTSDRPYRILGIPTPAEVKAAADKAAADAKAAADKAKADAKAAEDSAKAAADAKARADLFGAKPGLPAWALPAGIGAVVVLGGALFFVLRGKS